MAWAVGSEDCALQPTAACMLCDPIYRHPVSQACFQSHNPTGMCIIMTGHGMGVPVFWSQDRCALVMPLQKARGSSGNKTAGMVSGGMNHYSKPQLL